VGSSASFFPESELTLANDLVGGAKFLGEDSNVLGQSVTLHFGNLG
jgi:hypothetical protein